MRLKRDLFANLKSWKAKSGRKPLILNGVRQCGKTWLLKEFGQVCFNNTAYFNFDETPELAKFFEGDLNIQRLITGLGAFSEKPIKPETTLLIFDEIQSAPRALNSLKYFCENGPQYAVTAAGSLLGLTLASIPNAGFPVGKVDFLELCPCTFREYLRAANPSLFEFGENSPLEPIPDALADRFKNQFFEYLGTGGMPESVSSFLENRDWEKVDEILNAVILSYKFDFTKHAGSREEQQKLNLLWSSIPVQLGRGNDRFFFGEVRSGARARDLEDALHWIVDSRIGSKVDQVTIPQIPLSAYRERKNFKLYLSDTGVLRAAARISPAHFFNGTDLFAEFKGRYVENYVQQQLTALGYAPLSYWTSGRTAEVDFLLETKWGIIPVEVKSGTNRNAKSLKLYRQKYSPPLAVRASLLNLKWEDGLLNIPLYLLHRLPEFLNALLS